MKKIFRSVAALAVVMFAGCTTDMTDDIMAPAAGGSTTITVGFDETKTSLGELVDGTRKVYWSAGDKIAVNGITSAEAVINEETKGVAEFTFEGTLTAPYSALYPAEAYVDAQTINLAANQGRGLENVAANALPMAGYSTSEEFTVLHHLAGAFRFRIKKSANEDADAHVIHHVELRGNNGEQLSGNFAIDYASATLTGTSTDEADKVAYSLVNKASVTESEMNVFVIVPAGTYEQGITLRIVDAAGHYMDVKATTSQTINKGEIKAMPVVELVPTGTLINVEIKSAGDLLAFAQDYNAGKYFNVSPFVVEVTEDIVFDDATSAAWEPIGCEYAEGTEEYNKFGATNYFNGEFEGNGHSIKNWVTSKPLFAFSGSNGSIRNLTIDSSCTVTPTFASNPDGQFATLVGYHKGLITNCHNNANITISGEWSANARIGGVAGRIVGGEINGCTVNGDLTVDNGFTTTGSAYIGGVLGASTNTESVVKDSHFRGNLSFQGAVTKSGGYYFIGGIVGMFRGKSLTNCTTQKENGAASINVSPVATAYTDGLVGGIVGQADAGEIKGCANYATIDYAINTTDYTQLGVGGVIK